ncbi:response regulators consisting of a CheY-like receiver domain and a winged-helix DNA-binding domain [Longilinea arvoryzae]|uniref:Response regulators consisting of a CheY-like receiver domain and a winged-helix DNA-binding domain n=1 Tax=Longilinea arvoryzae TaxID=360412 RepID=A0A0S7BA95_9CHLR|nr:response regulator transcription factor [Longilinea arvoryzae]GAP14524.1 response regulators consisting of a CheY-like receiver domain and a winged-helix DNA-binding domain [Longilinea arvoryzae]
MQAYTSSAIVNSSISPGVDLDEVYATERVRVLVVDDDSDLVVLIKHILRSSGFDVLSANNGVEALRRAREVQPDLVLLDLMMPEMDGWVTLQNLRQFSNAPVIVLSALSSKDEIVRCLYEGVDDYMTKPFYKGEVVARINAVLRRAKQPRETTRFTFPKVGLVIDIKTQEVIFSNHSIQLTAKEFALLALLAKNAPGVVSYPVIAQTVWGEDVPNVRQRTKYLIFLLRRKFEEIDPNFALIQSMDRMGYKLKTE